MQNELNMRVNKSTSVQKSPYDSPTHSGNLQCRGIIGKYRPLAWNEPETGGEVIMKMNEINQTMTSVLHAIET